MYTLQHASVILGKEEGTIRNWMRKYGIKGTLMTIDRRRLYIADSDMLTLVDHANRKRLQNPIQTAMLQKYRLEDVKKEEDIAGRYNVEEKQYSLADAALFLGVARVTLSRWISLHHIEKIRRAGNKRVIYIAHTDVLMLLHHYRRGAAHDTALNTLEDMKEIKRQLKDLKADMEDMKHDISIYVKKSIYLGRDLLGET